MNTARPRAPSRSNSFANHSRIRSKSFRSPMRWSCVRPRLFSAEWRSPSFSRALIRVATSPAVGAVLGSRST